MAHSAGRNSSASLGEEGGRSWSQPPREETGDSISRRGEREEEAEKPHTSAVGKGRAIRPSSHPGEGDKEADGESECRRPRRRCAFAPISVEVVHGVPVFLSLLVAFEFSGSLPWRGERLESEQERRQKSEEK